MRPHALPALFLILAAPALSGALPLPQASPSASVSQVIGTTGIRVDYHRPGVRGRAIWGGLVPYGEPWRMGANEATVIRFSDPVKVEGREVPAGEYALFAIPGKEQWVVILSRNAKQWGTYQYKPEEDLLRFPVKPQGGLHTERLLFQISPLTESSVRIEMAWERLRVPFTVEVDVKGIVERQVRQALAGGVKDWESGWQAAAWFLDQGLDADQALTWAKASLGLQENTFTLATTARALDRKGGTREALGLLDKARTAGEAAGAPKEWLDALDKTAAEWRARMEPEPEAPAVAQAASSR